MQIVKITKKEIFCYLDYEFMIFNRQYMMSGQEIVGVVWAGGKYKQSPKHVSTADITKGSTYYTILIMKLIEIAEIVNNKGEI